MMAEKLVATIEQRRSGARLIKLAGVLDEENGLGELIEKVGTGMALINLSGLERINSHGTRDWVNWLASLEAKGIHPVLIACSPAVVSQLNRIKNFVGNAVVKSFQVPYFCATCTRDKLLLVHIADLGEAPHTAPECLCDGCSAPMEVVDETGEYFAFVSQLPPPPKNEPKVEAEPEAAPEQLARGSRASVTDLKAVSQPRLTKRGSRPSLSAFQMGEAKRPSEREILLPRAMPINERPYLIAIIALLFCVLGILSYLLLM